MTYFATLSSRLKIRNIVAQSASGNPKLLNVGAEPKQDRRIEQALAFVICSEMATPMQTQFSKRTLREHAE
jgi:hypothetical protein